MSRNVASHRPEQQLAQTLNNLGRVQTSSRSLQPQGSEALEIQSLFGYYFLTIPDGSIATNSIYLTLTSQNPEVTCIASIVQSAYVEYPVVNNQIVNADLDNHGISDDTWRVWMTYDSRPDFGAAMSVPYLPSATLESRLADQMASTRIAPYQANVGFKYSRMTNAARPADVGEIILFLFEIRILIG